ncbi:uncharacterized protein LOC118821617 [Colossoma macropomum]|uniref:uncharacterized protein LOC118821617 n=1 Tax=Colossoma macropomum TaxID=42526 RepID=UPI0018654C05|nr:uncharacterized protein LOC118821617 [Colossoma macropomum]
MHYTGVLSLFLLSLAVRGHSASVEHEALSVCGGDAVLRCLAATEPGVRYQSVIWYKVSEASSRKLTGLVMKRLTQNNGTIQRYRGLMREVELLEDSQSLLLPNVTVEDAGTYLCFLSAPLGHQNQEREIHLRVYEQLKDDARQYEENDTIYLVLAITLLIAALLMFYVSYICLRNTLINHKDKFSKDARLKTTQKMKHLIVSLESKGVVSKISAQEYV